MFSNVAVEPAEADLHVAAAINALHMKFCAQPSSFGNSTFQGTSTVDWQALDPLERKLVFGGTTQGQGKVSGHPATLAA